jgi:hypothetical protein
LNPPFRLPDVFNSARIAGGPVKTTIQQAQIGPYWQLTSPTKLRDWYEQMLKDALQQLTATGSSGFEGLIQRLLGRLTGYQFYLAQSGSQAGRDMSELDPISWTLSEGRIRCPEWDQAKRDGERGGSSRRNSGPARFGWW